MSTTYTFNGTGVLTQSTVIAAIGDAASTPIIVVNGYSSIDINAFFNCLYLTSISISDTILLIEMDAFYGCTNLKTVYISEAAGRKIGIISPATNVNFFGATGVTTILPQIKISYLSNQIMSYKNSSKQKVQNLIKIFLKDVNETSYTNMKNILDSAHSAFSFDNNLLNIVIYAFDGTVCYDSSSNNNAYENFVNKSNGVIYIFPPEIIKCIVKPSGSAELQRRDDKSGKVLKYKAVCLKSSDNIYLGIISISTSVNTSNIT